MITKVTGAKKAAAFLKTLFFPPKCAGCKALLNLPFGSECHDALCPECIRAFEKSKLATCYGCNREIRECECMPGRLAEAGCNRCIKLTKYKPGGGGAANNLIYYIKRTKNKNAFSFIAEQLSRPLGRYLEENGIKTDNVIITHLPRRKAAVSEYGFDQAREIAKALSEKLGIKAEALITRRGGAEQKRLTGAERAENVRRAFVLSKNAVDMSIEGKTVIVADDIITTGAGMAECTKILLEAGAAKVVAMCISVTESLNK